MAKNKIFMFGLDNAGKTTLSEYIRKEKVLDDPQPTKSFNIGGMILESLDYVIWDAPGQLKYRQKWSKGILDTNILVFVLDTADKERFDEAKEVLYRVLNDLDTRGVQLIVCFHKMDLEAAQENFKMAKDTLQLSKIDEREGYWFKTSVKTGEGIEELKEKLVEVVEKSRWG
ncbi:MAG: ADP-ribosylation factor-like protein [Promethearchaeia archaeon]